MIRGASEFLAALLARFAEAIDRRWPGGDTDDGDDTEKFLIERRTQRWRPNE